MQPPDRPKIYHIVHVDRLASIIADRHLLSDAMLLDRPRPGTVVGMSHIKTRRLRRLQLSSHPGLFVGQCVPFYFCPRSVMLYMIHCANHEDLAYRGGQESIIHLEGDLMEAVAWADEHKRRWAFTTSNAGAAYFEDRADLARLGEIDWSAVAAARWAGGGLSRQVKEGKQAEFLVERTYPWRLVQRIGVRSRVTAQAVATAMAGAEHRPRIEVRTDWYY